MKKNKDKTLRGRNSVMVGIRVTNEEYGLLAERAEGKGVSVGGLVKEVMQQWLHAPNATASAPTVQREGYAIKIPLALYNPLVHKAGDSVLVKVGGRLRESVVPELDGDGREIPK